MDDDRIDALYAAPLDRFIAERDAYVAALRDAGDREGAASVKALTKPSVPAWAVNQLARVERGAMEELAAIGARLRAAHQGVLDGGAPADLLAARDEEQGAIAKLIARAEALLAEAGFAPIAGRSERIGDTLAAVATDEATAATVLAGRLTKELQRVGFGDVLVPATAKRPAPPSEAKVDEADPADARRAAIENAQRAADHAQSARQFANDAAARADEIELEARRARASANEARRDAERAEREAAAAAKEANITSPG